MRYKHFFFCFRCCFYSVC